MSDPEHNTYSQTDNLSYHTHAFLTTFGRSRGNPVLQFDLLLKGTHCIGEFYSVEELASLTDEDISLIASGLLRAFVRQHGHLEWAQGPEQDKKEILYDQIKQQVDAANLYINIGTDQPPHIAIQHVLSLMDQVGGE